jgi:D-alanyl-D-alanine carboxypeptidase (penicillin-binding protein 5/6)
MRRSVRLISVLTASGLLGGLPLTSAQAATALQARRAGTVTAQSGPSGITAKGAYLYDATKGKKLWGRATTTRRPIGSITKVMTAVVVLRAGNLDRKITIKKSYVDHVKHNDATTAGLRTGDKVTVRQLLNGMLLPSGCDAAYALSDVYGPGQTKFVAKMNKTAASLGMAHTHFLNSDGLPTSSRHEGYSTPHDLILLARYAMKSTNFRAVVARRTYKLASGSGHHAYTWTSTNLLLGSYRGAIGIKTGHTNAAGYCLLFAARRGSRTLIGLLLDSTTTDPNRRFKNAAKVLDWGFGAKHAEVSLRSLPAGVATD